MSREIAEGTMVRRQSRADRTVRDKEGRKVIKGGMNEAPTPACCRPPASRRRGSLQSCP